MNTQGFTPIETKTLSATTTSSSASFTAATGVLVTQMRVYNAGTDLVFIRWGVGAQTAVATDTPIPSGAIEVFNKGLADTVAVIASTGTATVYVTAGEGA